MGSALSMLSRYDIEEVQEHCNYLFSQQEIASLYERFQQLDRNAKGFISNEEILSVPEIAVNPLSHRLLNTMDGLNFMDFVAFLSAFSTKASVPQKVEFIFKIYDSDGNDEASFDDVKDSFFLSKQREEILAQVLRESGYAKESILALDDFIKIPGKSEQKMSVEVAVKQAITRLRCLIS